MGQLGYYTNNNVNDFFNYKTTFIRVADYCLYFLIQKTKYFCSNDKRNYKTCKRRKCPDQLHLVVMKI